MTYDVIVVGTRVAGASTAMLLARRGLRVLGVDRARFPSDTLSTHQVQVPGSVRLQRWGLLDAVRTRCGPGAHRWRFDAGPAVVDGVLPAQEGIDVIYSPRRRDLDTLLVEAARSAGADMEEGFAVDEVCLDEHGRVTGVRGRDAAGTVRVETATLVVGADGRRSRVARAVGARDRRRRPSRTAAFYAYWSGLPVTGGETFGREGLAVGLWPTSDDLTLTFVAVPVGELDAFRADADASLRGALGRIPGLAERVAAAQRVEPVRGTPDLPAYVRASSGPGWVLVGDAGLAMDPVTGQGIGHALRDAELVDAAVGAALDAGRPLDAGLPGYERQRDAETMPVYKLTEQVSRLSRPDRAAAVLFGSIAASPDETSRFLGSLTGTYPLGDYLSGRNLRRVVGTRGMLTMALGRGRAA